jgi:HTH-type transcriptional regulator, quorum sensing regulator NprR
MDRKDYDTAFINYNDAMAIYKDIKQDKMIPRLYWRIGLCKTGSLQYKDALSYFDICERYSEMYKDTETHQLVLYDMALCYKKINKLDLALESIEKYLLSSNKEDGIYFYANILKANCYEAMGKYDIVIEIYNFLLAELPKLENSLLGYIYNNLGLVYLDKVDFKTSLQYFEMAEKIKNDVDKSSVCHTLIEKSELFFRQHLYTEAIKTTKLGLKDAEIYKDYEYLLKGNYSLSRIYESMHDISNLKKTYLTIADILRINNDFSELTSIYVKLSLIYLNENDIEEGKRCLILSQNLNE